MERLANGESTLETFDNNFIGDIHLSYLWQDVKQKRSLGEHTRQNAKLILI